MSDLEAGAGAHLELGPVSLGAILNLQAGIESIAKAFSDWRQAEADYQYGAIDVTLTGAGTTDASKDDIVFCLGGPPQERVWEVRQLSVGANSPATGSLTGVAYFMRGASQPLASPFATGGAQLTMINSVYSPPSIPNWAFYSARQIVLHAPDRLWCVIVGGNASTQFVVNGLAIESPDRRRAQTVQL
jgi:hypothetical protein